MAVKRLLGIEICDLGITAAYQDSEGPQLISLDGKEVELSSFAQLTGKGEVVFGKTSFKQFLISEIPVDNQFWYRLGSVDDASSAKKGSKYQPPDSDLAQAHLMVVFEKCRQALEAIDEVAIAVPGHFKASKLGSIIQVAREAGLPVTHVIDSALAGLLSASSLPESESLVVADLHWNSADVVRIQRLEDSVERIDVVSDRGLGLRLILDRLIDGVVKRFIDECRVDPAARPEYAQELYNQIYDYLVDTDIGSSCKLEIAKGSITVNRVGLASLIEKELQSLGRLVQRAREESGDSKPGIFLSSRLNRVPGLAAFLTKEISIKPIRLTPGQAALGALAFINAMEEPGSLDQPLFHTLVEFKGKAPAASGGLKGGTVQGEVFVSGASGILKSTPVTHLLFQGRLLPLPQSGDPDFVVGKSKSIASGFTIVEKVEGLADWHIILRRRQDGELEMVNNGRNTTSLNGESVASSETVVLHVGDVLMLGDPVLQLMVVGLVSKDA